ncbi:MAG: hypothetical protein HQ536_03115 [Parcubacteria group bacterium]|nr:hypothetical protein [Parcubacteria group bacterium]
MKVPEDVISSGNRDADCYATLYGVSEKETLEKRDEYLKEYPTEGYNTRVVSQPTKQREGYWCCRITRWHSCE